MYSNCVNSVVIQAGQFQIIETTAMTPSTMGVCPINTHGNPLLSFDITASCQALAFGDSGGKYEILANLALSFALSNIIWYSEVIFLTKELMTHHWILDFECFA